jgi:hypothetical protein
MAGTGQTREATGRVGAGTPRTARCIGAGLGLVLVLAACGSGASGGIGLACLTGPRQTADQRALCGCIQGVADRSLSAADQRRMVPFFADPERAHSVRLSDTPRNDAFWARYMAFVQAAEATCGPDSDDDGDDAA